MQYQYHHHPQQQPSPVAASEAAIKHLETTEDLSEFHALASSSGWLDKQLKSLPGTHRYTLLAPTNNAITQPKTGPALKKLKADAVAGDEADKKNISDMLDMHLFNGEMAGLNAFEAPNNDEVLKVHTYTNFGVANTDSHNSYRILVMPHGQSRPSATPALSSYGVGNEVGDLSVTHYTETAGATAGHEYPNLNLVDDTNQILFGNIKVAETAAHLRDEGNISVVHVNRLFVRGRSSAVPST